MKIETITLEACEATDWRSALAIKINGKKVFDVADGEPEDATLARDFSDCYGVSELLVNAFKDGQNDDGVDIERTECKTWDEWEEAVD